MTSCTGIFLKHNFFFLHFQIEREKTKGSKWFDMPAQELTTERKNDFLVYQMRKSLDPKRFYKTNDAVGIPKYYQVIIKAQLLY